MSGSGIRTARRPICCPASTPWCTWPGRRSPGDSPTRTRRRSATAASGRPAASPRPLPTPTTARARSSAPRRSAIYGFDRGDARAVRGKCARRRLPRRRRRGLGGRDGAGRRGGPAGRQRAHRNRAVRQRRHAAADAPAVRRGTGRPRRQRPAVAVVDRARRPARRLLPRAVRRPVVRTGQRRRARRRCATPTTPRRSPGCCTVRRCCRCRRWGRGCCWGSRASRELAEADQRVAPTKLETLGHRFRHPRIDGALAHELGHG